MAEGPYKICKDAADEIVNNVQMELEVFGKLGKKEADVLKEYAKKDHELHEALDFSRSWGHGPAVEGD